MNPPRRRHRRLQLEIHWGRIDEQEYDRYIPRLVAQRLRIENPVDVGGFVQNMRTILQRQRVHFDRGEGDGVHVFNWRQPTRPIPENGGGDAYPQRQQQHQNRQPPGGNAANRRRR